MTIENKRAIGRLVETLVMSLVSGGIIATCGLVFALPVVQEQVKSIQANIAELNARFTKFDERFEKLDDRVRQVEIRQAGMSGKRADLTP